MEYSIVIVNYNVKDLVVNCINSIYRFFPDNLLFEIIVIDNNSSDGSVEEIGKLFPMVHVIENNFNAGFPEANNQGFRISKGRYIFMLNPDTEIASKDISGFLEYLKLHSEISAVCPMLINTDGSHQLSIWKFPTFFSVIAEMLYLHKLIKKKFYLDKDFSQPFLAESASGAALLFRRELIDEIGELNEYLFWIEDVDFCYRMNKSGHKLMYYPHSKIIHHIGQSAKKNYKVSVSNQVFNKIKFFKVHQPGFNVFLLSVFSFFYCLFKGLVFFILSPFSTIYFKKAWAYWYTSFRVFNL